MGNNNSMTIDELIKLPEEKTLEFKRDTSALKKIMQTIVAFANTAGGSIIIGLEDSGEIYGVDDPLLTEEQLTSSISDSIAPMLIPDIEIGTVEGKAGLSRIRNRVIVRTFKELGLMEEWGSGYKRIYDFCIENGYPVPEWQEVGPTLRVTIYPHPEAKEIAPHVTPHVTPHVKRLLNVCAEPTNREQLQISLGVKDRKYFYEAYLNPALKSGLIEYTIPDKPKSKLQQYRLTESGRIYFENQ